MAATKRNFIIYGSGLALFLGTEDAEAKKTKFKPKEVLGRVRAKAIERAQRIYKINSLNCRDDSVSEYRFWDPKVSSYDGIVIHAGETFTGFEMPNPENGITSYFYDLNNNGRFDFLADVSGRLNDGDRIRIQGSAICPSPDLLEARLSAVQNFKRVGSNSPINTMGVFVVDYSRNEMTNYNFASGKHATHSINGESKKIFGTLKSRYNEMLNKIDQHLR